MSTAPFQRGAAAVGVLGELPPLEAALVLYIRLWHTSCTARHEVARDFNRALGAEGGAEMLELFEAFCAAAATSARRPLIRHEIRCRCLGADESALAHLVAAAADGAHEDAELLAALLMERGSVARIAGLARALGAGLARMFPRADEAPEPGGHHVTHAIQTAVRH